MEKYAIVATIPAGVVITMSDGVIEVQHADETMEFIRVLSVFPPTVERTLVKLSDDFKISVEVKTP